MNHIYILYLEIAPKFACSGLRTAVHERPNTTLAKSARHFPALIGNRHSDKSRDLWWWREITPWITRRSQFLKGFCYMYGRAMTATRKCLAQGVEFLMENEKKHEKFPIHEKFSHVSMRKRGGQKSLVSLTNAIYCAIQIQLSWPIYEKISRIFP